MSRPIARFAALFPPLALALLHGVNGVRWSIDDYVGRPGRLAPPVLNDRLDVGVREVDTLDALRLGRVAGPLVLSVEAAAEGIIRIWHEHPETKEVGEFLQSEHFACVECGVSFEELAPRMFSFNSPHGRSRCSCPFSNSRSRSLSPRVLKIVFRALGDRTSVSRLVIGETIRRPSSLKAPIAKRRLSCP